MELNATNAEIFVPDGTGDDEALARTTHMAIGAHPDDLEIMGPSLILACYGRKDQWYCGVVTTDGSGSPRGNLYADTSDAAMTVIRQQEQRKAAYVGEYGALCMLKYTSAAVKDGGNADVKEDVKALLGVTKPRVLATHNLADKHPTHVGTAVRTVQALRELPDEAMPETFLGFEVWRGLDWMLEEESVQLDISVRDNISNALVALFDSQISGGKRYDFATAGRRRERATYLASHGTDTSELLTIAMDLMPLLKDPSLDIAEYTTAYVENFKQAVKKQIAAVL